MARSDFSPAQNEGTRFAMPTSLLTDGIWPRITALVRKSRRANVAVAWCAAGSRKLLPLKEGSVLVTNLSEEAVKAGQTKPQELLPLVRRGVKVHSVRNLHAKVFTFDDAAVIGSTNASTNSSNTLIEAVLLTTDTSAVRNARAFVRSLGGDLVGEAELKRLAKMWKPPRFPGAGNVSRRRTPKRMVAPLRSPLWVVKLGPSDPDEKDEAIAEQGRTAAKAKKKNRLSGLDEFMWTGSGAFQSGIRSGHLVLQAVVRGASKMVYPACRAIHLSRYKVGREKRMQVWLEVPQGRRGINLARYLKKISPWRKKFGAAHGVMVRNRTFAGTLLGAWPT